MNGRARELRISVSDMAMCLLLLFFAFLLLKTKSAVFVSGIIAKVLAQASAWILLFLGFNLQQTGTELRDAASGAALNVTQACDGLGIFVTLAAGLFAFKTMRKNALQIVGILVGAFLGLQLFNILRVVSLFSALPAGSSVFETMHLYFFPLLSSVAIVVLALAFDRRMRPENLISVAKWIALAMVLVWLWSLISEQTTRTTVVHLAQAWLTLTGSGLMIIGEGKDAVLQATTLQSTSFYPSDFTLVLPLVLASSVIAGLALARTWMAFATVMISISIAMALAAWGGASTAFGAPHSVIRTLAAALQDALVYANLLLVPWLLLLIPHHRVKAPATPGPVLNQVTKRRKKAANGRR
jgi:exosortase/archaeosortase family protein